MVDSRRGCTLLWDEIAAESETKAKIVSILKNYRETMENEGRPYRNS